MLFTERAPLGNSVYLPNILFSHLQNAPCQPRAWLMCSKTLGPEDGRVEPGPMASYTGWVWTSLDHFPDTAVSIVSTMTLSLPTQGALSFRHVRLTVSDASSAFPVTSAQPGFPITVCLKGVTQPGRRRGRNGGK